MPIAGLSLPNIMPGVLRAADEQPFETDLSITEGLFVKCYRVPKSGTFLPQHSHLHSHVTVLAVGKISVFEDGVYKCLYTAPASFVVPAGKKHAFGTRCDGVVILCIHRVGPDGEPEILEEHQLVR
jgi:hypothetical protein